MQRGVISILRLHEARADFAFWKAAYDGQIKDIEGHEKVIAKANKEITEARENAEKRRRSWLKRLGSWPLGPAKPNDRPPGPDPRTRREEAHERTLAKDAHEREADELYEMTNLYPRRTGLPMTV